ncbi:MAG: hypothetical protein ACKO9A_15040, partial [Alphaproteobacteria bacterium]
LRSAPYSNLLFPGYTRVERGKLRASAIAALERRDSLGTREFLEADIGGALDYLIDVAKGGGWPTPAIDCASS